MGRSCLFSGVYWVCPKEVNRMLSSWRRLKFAAESSSTTVVTTRRVLERLAVTYFSQRMAWKLLKDVPKSAIRKAGRGMPTFVYFIHVSRTTFRGHFLGVAASWLVQVGIDIYKFISSMFNSEEEIDKTEGLKLLGKKVVGTTIRCGSSLVFASIGAGIGATLFRPWAGQWIGCGAGDFAGPIIVAVCFEKFLHLDLKKSTCYK